MKALVTTDVILRSLVNYIAQIQLGREKFDENGEKLQEILKQNFLVYIDQKQMIADHWYYRQHPITKQDGFYTRVDISNLENGKHELDMKFIGYWEENNIDTFTMRWIPFWKVED